MNDHPMILESLVTSVDARGVTNLAPMGPTVDRNLESIILRPFQSSKTYKNLTAVGEAVVHVSDDAMLFARAAMDAITPEETEKVTVPFDDSKLRRLVDCHRWFRIEIESSTEDERRATMRCRITQSETVRPFFGFNRAKFAVLEAAILGTRTHMIPQEEINQSIDRLRVLVDKTGGDQEHAAFDFLAETIHDRYANR